MKPGSLAVIYRTYIPDAHSGGRQKEVVEIIGPKALTPEEAVQDSRPGGPAFTFRYLERGGIEGWDFAWIARELTPEEEAAWRLLGQKP